MFYIGIDCGTQGTKAIVFDADSGKILSKGYAKHAIIALEDGTREQKVEWWISALEEAVESALEKSNIDRKKVNALAVSGQQHGLVLLNSMGAVLRNVKLWNDTSTTTENDNIISASGGIEGVWENLGTALPVGFTASKVRYVLDREPDLYSQVAHILLPHDYINYYLTNKFGTDSSEASGTGYYDVNKRKYSEKALQIVDESGKLKDAIPPVYSWNKPLGTLRTEIANRWGLRNDVLVAIGGGDNTMGAIGTSAIIDGNCTMSLGTSGTVCMIASRDTKNIDRLVQVYDVLDSKSLVTICTLNATSATTTVQELFDLSIAELDEAIMKAELGSSGVLVVPFFDGERMPPLPTSNCVIKNLNSINCKKENIVRATAEAVIYNLKWGFDKLMKVVDKPEKIIITGGGGNSKPWKQIISDVFNLPVYGLETDEGGAFGAAIQALYAYKINLGENVTLPDLCNRYVKYDEAKKIEPVEANVKAYSLFFEKYINEVKKEWNL